MAPEPIPTIVAEEIDIAQPAVKVLLIDLENCPGKIQQLQEDLKDYTKVVICYANTGAKIPLDWLMALNETINSNRLQIYKMETAGKNSADFGICFFAGMLAQQLGQSANFTIVSDDTDLDHLVSLLISQAHTAKRQGKLKPIASETKVIASAPIVVKDVANGVYIYCSHLINHRSNRPASVTTLKNSICSLMNKNKGMSEAVFEQLVELKVVIINNAKISYADIKIKSLISKK